MEDEWLATRMEEVEDLAQDEIVIAGGHDARDPAPKDSSGVGNCKETVAIPRHVFSRERDPALGKGDGRRLLLAMQDAHSKPSTTSDGMQGSGAMRQGDKDQQRVE